MLKSLSPRIYDTNVILGGFIVFALWVAVSCASGVERRSNAQIVNATSQAALVIGPGADLERLFNSGDCKEFFRSFPSDFNELEHLYGYDESKGPQGEGILYSRYETHIPFFFSCDEVSDLDKLDRAIHIGIDGRWEADSVAMFRDLTLELVRKYPNESAARLDNMPDKKASSFWFFMFDGPHPGSSPKMELFHSVQTVMKGHRKQYSLLNEQVEKLLLSHKTD